MNWTSFLESVGHFFSDIGMIFLANIKAAIPVAEQAAQNFLVNIVDAIIAGIESGVIPLPVFASEGAVDPLTAGKTKREVAFAAIQKKLVETPPPTGMAISTSSINWAIETSVKKYKINNSGNQGNGGPTGDFSK